MNIGLETVHQTQQKKKWIDFLFLGKCCRKWKGKKLHSRRDAFTSVNVNVTNGSPGRKYKSRNQKAHLNMPFLTWTWSTEPFKLKFSRWTARCYLAVLFRSLLYSGFRDAGGHAIKSRNNVCVWGGESLKGRTILAEKNPLEKDKRSGWTFLCRTTPWALCLPAQFCTGPSASTIFSGDVWYFLVASKPDFKNWSDSTLLGNLHVNFAPPTLFNQFANF